MDQACIDFGVSEFGCTLISIGLYVGYAIFFVAVVAVVVLPLMNALKEPKELAKSAAAVGGIAVIFLIVYSISGDEVTLKTASMGTTPGSSKLIGAGLMMFYVFLVVSIIGLIYSFFSKSTR
jgi:drug/metabolite transporter superfamily protein YnfA